MHRTSNKLTIIEFEYKTYLSSNCCIKLAPDITTLLDNKVDIVVGYYYDYSEILKDIITNENI